MIISNCLKRKLYRSENRLEKKHLEEICKSRLQFMISLDGSYASYKSMFMD